MVNQEKKTKSFIFFLIVSLFILLLDHFKILNPIKGFFEEKLVIPLRIKFSKSAPASPLESCQEKDLEILKLETQIASLKEENLSAKKLLGAPLPSDWKFLPAKVLSEDRNEIIIDKGEKDNVSKGMVAVAAGLYLGRVSQTSESIAKVRLVFSPDSKEVVKIIAKESLTLVGKGLLFGKGEGKMGVKEILAEEEVSQGDLVVVFQEGGDLPIGKIARVDYNKGEVFKTAEVVLDLEVRKLETLFLVIGKI